MLAALVLPLFGADRPVRIGVAVMAVAAWAALRFSLGPPLPATGSVMAAIAMVLPLMAHFVLKLAWPWPLSDSYSLVYNAPGPAQIALAVALATLCSVLCIRRGGRRAVLGLAMAMLCALPATLAVAAYHLMADRYATLPLLGLTVALAAALPDRRLCAAPLLLLLPIWIALDSLRIPDWDSSLSLAQSAASLTPSPYSAGWLGEELRKAGRPSEALPWYLLALKGNPPFCMFAGQTLSVAMAAGHGIAAGQAIQDAGCQGVPDFRARWAAACLIEGQPDGADRIMSPRPDTCDRASGPVLAALAVLDHEPLDMAACAAEAGVPLQTLQASADRLVQFAQ